jgi:uncharacterized protein with FMN-binding domain
LLGSNREVKTVNAVNPRKSRGLLQAVALLGLSTVGAFALIGHNTPSTSSAAGTDSATTSSGPKTATGDAINYQFGTVQVEVTKSGGKITAVNLIQASATAGREGAFSYLVNYAISANGSSFSNLSGATYTTEAFKQALDSAISKL